jgi:hypothetical protein
MGFAEPVPVVRCRLSGPDETESIALRFVPLVEFGLWRFLMENRHRRLVRVEAVSVWVSEETARWNSGIAAEDLEPVVRLRVDLPGPFGIAVPVERFFPAETFPDAREALLSHFGPQRRPVRVVSTPGYFVPPDCAWDGTRLAGEGVA